MYVQVVHEGTVCEHTVLVASVFSAVYQVPDKLVAETPALRKKTSMESVIAESISPSNN